jgi:hypothetical protein
MSETEGIPETHLREHLIGQNTFGREVIEEIERSQGMVNRDPAQQPAIHESFFMTRSRVETKQCECLEQVICQG